MVGSPGVSAALHAAVLHAGVGHRRGPHVVVSHGGLDLGTHTFFVGEVVEAAVRDDDVRAAAMADTRMKYGGVKRR